MIELRAALRLQYSCNGVVVENVVERGEACDGDDAGTGSDVGVLGCGSDEACDEDEAGRVVGGEVGGTIG